jgi:hypothetical protein
MALFGWGKKSGEDDKSKGTGAAKDAKSTTPPPQSSLGYQTSKPPSNPANDESGELGAPKAPTKTDALRDELREMLRKKLGILADIKDSGLESMADHQINLPISINIAVKDGKIDSTIIRKKIDILLEASGFTDEAKRKKFRISEDGVNWNVPDAVAEQLLPKAEKRGKDFSATNYFRDNVVREIDGLDLADVVKIKGGFIITGVPGSTSRSKLVEGKSNAAELKNGITIDRVIAVDVMNSDVMPVLDAYRKEKAATEAALPKPPAETPKPDNATIPLAGDTIPPPAPTTSTKPSGNVIAPGTGEVLELAGEGDHPTALSAPVTKPAEPSSKNPNDGKTVDLEPKVEPTAPHTLPITPTAEAQVKTQTTLPKAPEKKWGFKIGGGIDVEAVRVNVRVKLREKEFNDNQLSMNHNETAKRFIFSMHPAQDDQSFRKMMDAIAKETGENISIEETGLMRWVIKQKDLDNWIEGKKPEGSHFKIRSDNDRMTGLKNFTGLPTGIELKQTGVQDLVVVDHVPANLAAPTSAQSIKTLKAVVNESAILRYAGIEDSRAR